MPNMVQLDAIDRAIVLELQKESRLPYAEIGARVGLSAAAVHERVKKLERKGVIQAYRIQVNPKAIGLQVTAFIAVRLQNDATCSDVAPTFADFPEVEECHSAAGDIDVLLKARTATPEDLEKLLYRIKRVPGVSRTTSTVVLSTQFEARPLIPVEAD